MSRRRTVQSRRIEVHQSELPLAATPKARGGVGVAPERAAKLAIARKAKPRAPPHHVRLVLTFELRLATAVQRARSAGPNEAEAFRPRGSGLPWRQGFICGLLVRHNDQRLH